MRRRLNARLRLNRRSDGLAHDFLSALGVEFQLDLKRAA